MTKTLAIVLAAGMGKRMQSDLPKVLCRVRNRPMIEFVLDALSAAQVDEVVAVIGHRGELVREALANRPQVRFVEQTERLGTGHAVQMALPMLRAHSGPVLVLAGDSPLVQASSLQRLLASFQANSPACLLGTLHKENPTGLGRIVRDTAGNFVGIVEEKDATPEQRQLTEVNMSTYVFAAEELVGSLGLLKNNNRQNEYYLTDCPGILKSQGKRVEALAVLQPCEALSINTVEDLQAVEVEMQRLGYPCAS